LKQPIADNLTVQSLFLELEIETVKPEM